MLITRLLHQVVLVKKYCSKEAKAIYGNHNSKSVNVEVSDKKISKSSSEIINHPIVALTDG